MGVATEVSAGGIRTGDPEALAGLCERRASAVLAYCEYVAAPGQSGPAAADAFARFRATAAAASEEVHAEALLLSAARHAAAARGLRAGAGADRHDGGDCPSDASFVSWIEETLPALELEHIEQHVAGCAACLEAVARFEAAERAYEDPPTARIPPRVARSIVDGLLAAAPVTAFGGDVSAVREAVLRQIGADAPPPREPAPAAAAAVVAAAAHEPSPDPIPNGTGEPPWPHGVRAEAGSAQARAGLASAAGRGAALVATVLEAFRKPRPSQPVVRPRRIGSLPVLGVALTSLVVLTVAAALLTSSDPSPSPGDSASPPSASSVPGDPADRSDATPEPRAVDAGARQPESTPRPDAAERRTQARRSGARRSARQRSRERSRRSPAASSPRRSQTQPRATAPRRSAPRRPAPRQTAPAPATQRRTRPPVQPSAPAPRLTPRPERPPSGGGSEELPGGEFSVVGET